MHGTNLLARLSKTGGQSHTFLPRGPCSCLCNTPKVQGHRATSGSNESHPGFKASCPIDVNLSCNNSMGIAARVSMKDTRGASQHAQGRTNTPSGVCGLFVVPSVQMKFTRSGSFLLGARWPSYVLGILPLSDYEGNRAREFAGDERARDGCYRGTITLKHGGACPLTPVTP